MGFKDKNWSHLWDEKNVKGEKKRGGRGRRRKEEEEEGSQALKRYGTNLGYGFYYGSYEFCMGF